MWLTPGAPDGPLAARSAAGTAGRASRTFVIGRSIRRTAPDIGRARLRAMVSEAPILWAPPYPAERRTGGRRSHRIELARPGVGHSGLVTGPLERPWAP